MIGAGQLDVLADDLLSHLLPARNPLLNWDKFFILALDAPGVSGRERVAPARPTPAPTPATPQDIDDLCAQRPEAASRYRRRIAEGHECHVFRDGGRVIARQWLIPDPPQVLTNSGWRFLPPVRPSVWGYDLFIDRAYRLRGYFVSFMENAARARGGVTPAVYVEVHFRNTPSLNACHRYGFRTIRTVNVWTCLGVRRYAERDADGSTTVTRRYGFDVPPLL